MFVNWAEQQLENDPDFHRKIIFSDEAHFWLNGFVNKQNMRYWSGSNPHVLHESPLHPEKITVWCGLWAGGVIGPYFFRFFRDDQDRHVTVNGNHYRSMITEYFWRELDDMDLDNMWFQQDGATSHTANVTIDLLKTKFDERVICYLTKWPSQLAASVVRFDAIRLFPVGLRQVYGLCQQASND